MFRELKKVGRGTKKKVAEEEKLCYAKDAAAVAENL